MEKAGIMYLGTQPSVEDMLPDQPGRQRRQAAALRGAADVASGFKTFGDIAQPAVKYRFEIFESRSGAFSVNVSSYRLFYGPTESEVQAFYGSQRPVDAAEAFRILNPERK